MNYEQIVRDFLALFHTQKLDVSALRSMLADMHAINRWYP